MFFSSDEEENYSPGEEEQVPTHVVERKGKGAGKPSRAVRTRKVPAKFREDYFPSISKEEERLQKSKCMCVILCMHVWVCLMELNRGQKSVFFDWVYFH